VTHKLESWLREQVSDVAAPARVKIVDAKNLVTFVEQSFAKMRA
jgi:hypothetical protein